MPREKEIGDLACASMKLSAWVREALRDEKLPGETYSDVIERLLRSSWGWETADNRLSANETKSKT
jgi:hypothetical protein